MTLRAGALACAVLVAAGAFAQGTAAGTPSAPASRTVRTAEDGPTWASLTLAQQSALAPLRAQWSTLDAPRKNKWITVVQRFHTLSEAERQRVQARMAEWARMSPAERGRARQNFQELRELPAGDRQALWEAYRALPEERRQQLAQKAARPAAEPASAASANDTRRKASTTPRAVQVRPVTPTVVQTKPGGTTRLVTKPAAPPPHHQPGMPKILAGKDFVNPNTLLPSRGPQGAATLAPASAAAFVPIPERTAPPAPATASAPLPASSAASAP